MHKRQRQPLVVTTADDSLLQASYNVEFYTSLGSIRGGYVTLAQTARWPTCHSVNHDHESGRFQASHSKVLSRTLLFQVFFASNITSFRAFRFPALTKGLWLVAGEMPGKVVYDMPRHPASQLTSERSDTR